MRVIKIYLALNLKIDQENYLRIIDVEIYKYDWPKIENYRNAIFLFYKKYPERF